MSLRLTFFILVFIPALRAQDWPMYLKDLAHSSFNSSEAELNSKNVATLQPDWTLSLGARLGSAPTLSNGVLYVGDWTGNFHAIDAQKGSEQWQKFLGKAPDPSDPTCQRGIGITSQATVVGNTVYVGGGDSAVYALDRSSGNQIWRVSLGDPASGSYLWSSIAPYKNGLYVGVASLGDCPLVRGSLARIDLQNPQQPLIHYLTPADQNGAGIWSTPAIDAAANAVLVTTGNGDTPDFTPANLSEALVSLDADTLAVKSYFRLPESEAERDFDWGSSATLFTAPNGVPMTAATGKDGWLYALRRNDLSLVWKTRLAVGCEDPVQGCGSISTPAFDGRTLFVGAGVRDPSGFALGSVYAMNPADGSVTWRRDTDGVVIAPVTIANGLLFVSTTQGLEIYDTATGQFLWSDNKRGLLFSQAVATGGTVFSTYLRGDVVAWRLPLNGTDVVYSYSAATGLPSLAPGAIASAYGPSLTSVSVQDGMGGQWTADVLYTSSGLINYVVPDGVAPGRATVTATSANGEALSVAVQISSVAPGVFSANSDGKGVAAAQALVVHANGTRDFLPVFNCGSNPGSCISSPIDLGSEDDQVFLVLYGTGIRGYTSLDNVSCMIGGVPAPMLYAGSEFVIEGLDQVNVLIPRSLIGRGEVDVKLSVDGQLSNTVTVNIR